MLGASFPDIRRISNITRAQTHNCFENLDLNFEGMTAFEAGWKFHVWCDLRRNEVLLEKGFFEIDEVHDCYYFSCYLLEDKLVWSEYNNWETLGNYFSDSTLIDVFENLTDGDWMFWFDVTKDFITNQPDKTSMRKLIRSFPSFVGRADMILEETDKLLKNKKVIEILTNIHKDILK